MRPPPPTAREVLALTTVVSFCSLVYEMSIASCFAMLTGDDVLWQSLTIALFLAALGAGSFSSSKHKEADPWPLFFRIEIGLAAAGAAVSVFILCLDTLYRFYFRFFRDYYAETTTTPYILVLILCHGGTLLIGYLSGFEIPLMIRAVEAAPGQVKGGLNKVLAANYGGALLGCLAFGFLLLPVLDIPGPCLVAAAVNLGVCGWLLYRGRVVAAPASLTRLVLAAAVLSVSVLAALPLYRFYVVNFYAGDLRVSDWYRNEVILKNRRPAIGEVLRRIADLSPYVERTRSRYQHIDLLSDQAAVSRREAHYNRRLQDGSDWPRGLTLFLNRRFQFRAATEAVYHEFMAHVPVQLFGKVPADVLILGGGDGLLARELLKYGEGVRSITNVELDPAVVSLARSDTRLRRLNAGAFDDPRVRVETGDAFFFVRTARKRYDAVYVDLPYPHSYDIARLYSVEFFRNVARILRPGGTLTLDYPMERQEDKKPVEDYQVNSIIASTLRAAGFRTLVPYVTRLPELVPVERAESLGIASPDYDPAVSRLLRGVETLRFRKRFPGGQPSDPPGDFVILDDQVYGETMVAATREARRPEFVFRDRGIRLDALTPERLRVLQYVRFPWEIQPHFENYVLRPVLYSPEHIEDFAFR